MVPFLWDAKLTPKSAQVTRVRAKSLSLSGMVFQSSRHYNEIYCLPNYSALYIRFISCLTENRLLPVESSIGVKSVYTEHVITLRGKDWFVMLILVVHVVSTALQTVKGDTPFFRFCWPLCMSLNSILTSSFNIMTSPFNFWTRLKSTDRKLYIAPLVVESVRCEGNN